ncbi:hypothetical protein PGN04_30410 [Klebsiella quasipneumoniae subsp. quasipneumoniae]|nr:hypothetical protein [Klebsiella quasipneumoniae]MDA5092104.1 hypothetical protein [Klebsiella quasipneumoniae subsp. quasipneumoniae]
MVVKTDIGIITFSVMDAGGRIVFSDFHLDADQLVKGLELV